jgi:hypothetical protein
VTLAKTALAELIASALLVTAVVSATRALSGTRRAVDRRVECSLAARRAMDAIVGALRNVRRDPLPRIPLVVGRAGGPDGSETRIDLQVISDARVRREGAESDQYECSFSLAKLPGRRLPALLCRRDHGLDEHPDQGGIVSVVAEGIIDLSFEYYADKRWREDWPASEPRSPEAVRVRIAALGPDPDDSAAMDIQNAGIGPPNAQRPVVLTTIVPLHVLPANDTSGQPQPQPQQQPQQQPPGQPTGAPPGQMPPMEFEQ